MIQGFTKNCKKNSSIKHFIGSSCHGPRNRPHMDVLNKRQGWVFKGEESQNTYLVAKPRQTFWIFIAATSPSVLSLTPSGFPFSFSIRISFMNWALNYKIVTIFDIKPLIVQQYVPESALTSPFMHLNHFDCLNFGHLLTNDFHL